MKNAALAALAAAAVANGATVSRIAPGLRSYEEREFYKDGKPVSNQEKADIADNAAYASWEKQYQENWTNRYA